MRRQGTCQNGTSERRKGAVGLLLLRFQLRERRTLDQKIVKSNFSKGTERLGAVLEAAELSAHLKKHNGLLKGGVGPRR